MLFRRENRVLYRSFFFLFIVTILLLYFFRWNGTGGRDYTRILKSDGFGYYAYLPSIFIHHDFGKEKNNLLYHVKTNDGKLVNKYTYGTALLESPFFLLGWLSAKISGFPDDGYSAPFQIAISIAALFYFLAGLFLFSKILDYEFSLNPAIRAVFVVILGLATTIIFYVVYLGSFSHVYSFFLINLCIFLFIIYRDRNDDASAFWFSLVLALVFITRPVNLLLIFFLPFFFRSGKLFAGFLRQQFYDLKKILILLAGFILPVFIQMILWKIQSGHFFYWSYKGEGFYFDQPHFMEFLFSFKKGLFIYCPVLIFVLPAFWIYLRNDRWKFLWSLIFFAFSIYIFSSWYCWYYADSFGMRPVIDFYGVFGIWLVTFVVFVKNIYLRLVYQLLLLLFIPVNLIFAYQHLFAIVHPNAMTAEKFAMVFMRTGEKYHDYFGGMDDGPPYAPDGFNLLHEKSDQFQLMPDGKYDITANEFPFGMSFIADSKFCAQDKLWIKLSYKKMITEETGGKDLLFVIQTTNANDSTLFYFSMKTKEIPREETNTWKQNDYSITINNPCHAGDKAGLYFWNRGKDQIWLDDISIQVLSPVVLNPGN